MKGSYLILGLLLLFLSLSACDRSSEKETLYIGNFSNDENSGIYRVAFDRETMEMQVIDTAKTPHSPSFFTIHPNKEYLYSVNRGSVSNEPNHGSISVFKIKNEGTLVPINTVSTQDSGPCYVNIDKSGEWLFTAHYGGGSWGAHQILPKGLVSKLAALYRHSGKSQDTIRQKAPHAHMVTTDPFNEYILISDLGLDQVKIHSIKPAFDSVNVIMTKAGSGPRHLAFHPELNVLYLAEELTSTISVWPFTPKDSMQMKQRLSTLPDDFMATNTVADIHVSPDGMFLYVSNRGHDSLAIFSVGPDGGLQLVEHQSTHGERPRNFFIDPKGDFIWVANRDSDEVVLFSRNKKTGMLKFTGKSITIPEPVCIKHL